MKQQRFGTTSEELSRIVQGCMGLARDWDGDPNGEAARRAQEARMDASLRELDDQIDALDADAQRTLDAEAVGVLRDQAYNGWCRLLCLFLCV